jgi:hypothetical protein
MQTARSLPRDSWPHSDVRKLSSVSKDFELSADEPKVRCCSGHAIRVLLLNKRKMVCCEEIEEADRE